MGTDFSDEVRTGTFPAVKESHEAVLAFVNEALSTVPYEERSRKQINMAVDEIFINIVEYAYGEEAGDMTLSLSFPEEGRDLELTFMDNGEPYNPLSQEEPDVTLSGRERRTGGLGIFLVKKTMDDMRYEYRDGKNLLTIRKKLVKKQPDTDMDDVGGK